jgi:hypothetical protein
MPKINPPRANPVAQILRRYRPTCISIHACTHQCGQSPHSNHGTAPKIVIQLCQIHMHNFKQEHIASCNFQKTPCPNKQYGCTKLLLQSQMEEHLERECRFIPVQCPWCSKKVHNKEVSYIKSVFSCRSHLRPRELLICTCSCSHKHS